MADERISSIAQEGVFKEQQELIKNFDLIAQQIVKLNGESRNLGDAFRSTNSLKGLADAQAKLSINAEKLAQAQSKAAQAQAQAETAILRAQQAAERQAQAQAKANQQANIARDSNAALSKTLNDLRAGYDRLTKAERENANIGGVLVARIQELDKQLKATDATTGRFQRNVGNYSGAVNGVRLEIRQLARELPSLQNGINTFISAIGNNLPMAVDAITRLREENTKLRAEGKPTTSVFKTLAGAIFNWQTAIIVVLTLLPTLVNAMKRSNSAATEAEAANKKYTGFNRFI